MSLLDFFRTKHINVLLCGIDGAGKTSITLTLSGLDPKIFPPKPTLGYNSPSFKSNGIKWVFWDVCGQAKFRGLWKSYYTNVIAVAYVIDAKDTERFQESKNLLWGIINDPTIRSYPILVWVNRGHSNELNDLPKDRVFVLDCDAYKGTGLKEGLKWLKKKLK
ncbi:ADP-ribosylation factor, putative [Entamoeba nuttalli P19]|uniref:ADP-ribosylation factor, putative n=1 Tax=Entamoeba nuttalli (strain P19) TaxID=1076696 RepID=K2H4I5_ENTNP|nr:ADP-ribosylation factor, putative [Entamoeba nuttalli P19]EKE37394.1 ADP-ribosylation factor, putative [Entamoeba nuttalli P19]|eukprot:XP_008860271.1 ADP-ribosylation factor, putative [Entamoeba nuttalli P19]